MVFKSYKKLSKKKKSKGGLIDEFEPNDNFGSNDSFPGDTFRDEEVPEGKQSNDSFLDEKHEEEPKHEEANLFEDHVPVSHVKKNSRINSINSPDSLDASDHEGERMLFESKVNNTTKKKPNKKDGLIKKTEKLKSPAHDRFDSFEANFGDSFLNDDPFAENHVDKKRDLVQFNNEDEFGEIVFEESSDDPKMKKKKGRGRSKSKIKGNTKNPFLDVEQQDSFVDSEEDPFGDDKFGNESPIAKSKYDVDNTKKEEKKRKKSKLKSFDTNPFDDTLSNSTTDEISHGKNDSIDFTDHHFEEERFGCSKYDEDYEESKYSNNPFGTEQPFELDSNDKLFEGKKKKKKGFFKRK